MKDLEVDALLKELAAAAAAETDAVFPAERCATQRARILQRAAIEGRPARVIAFPSTPPADSRAFRTKPAVRWIAAAAAAGLTIGLLVGRMTYQRPPRLSSRAATFAAPAHLKPVASLADTAVHLSDDELLDQIETAATGPVAVLRPLHELTPIFDQLPGGER